MEMYFVIKNVATGEYFTGADFQGAYFGMDDIRYFPTEYNALQRLKEESQIFPLQFANQAFQIIPVYKFN
jgi:hypothetical protein